MDNFTTLKIDHPSQFILQVTLNRPAVRNAINSDMMLDLQTLWTSLYTDTSAYRCVILTGAENAFCAGADLKERHKMALANWQKQRHVLELAMLMMRDCPIPIIAAVNGAAYGGGLELLLACDFAYAASTAMFSQSEVKVGLMPAAMGTQNLPKACGIRRARELTYTGQSFTAEQALSWGIVNKVTPPENLLAEVLSTAKTICENAPLAVRQVKLATRIAQESNNYAGFQFEITAYNHLLESKDRIEGMSAFNEKRKPNFVGE